MESSEYPENGEDAYDFDSKELIGAGGLGTVFKIKHINTGKYYALKVEEAAIDDK
jgi:hypothetical protein